MEELQNGFAMWFYAWILVGFLTAFKMAFVDGAFSKERRERFKNDEEVSRFLSNKTLFMVLGTALGFVTLAVYIMGWLAGRKERRS